MTTAFISPDGKTNADPFILQAEIRRRAGSLAALARSADVDRSTVQSAVYRCQPTGCRIIAEYLEVSVHRIWPEWFDRAGNVRPGARDCSRTLQASARQKGAAA